MKKKLVWLPAILWMLVIFYFSNQPAEVSGDLSGGISYRIVNLVASITGQDWSNEEMLSLAEKIDYPIRKLAHLTEYALLGMAVALGVVYENEWNVCNKENYKFNSYNRKEDSRRGCSLKRQYFATQIIGSLYAASDEIHQLFIPGRAGRISDVLIDSLGVLIGCGVFIIFLRYPFLNLRDS